MTEKLTLGSDCAILTNRGTAMMAVWRSVQTSMLILAVIILIGFIAYLGLLAFVVTRTGDTRGLRDVAVAVRTYRGVLAIVPKTSTIDDGNPSESDAVVAPRASRGDPSPDP